MDIDRAMVNPVHLQDNISKAPAAEKIHQTNQQRSQIEQRQFILQFKEEAIKRQETVNKTEEREEVLLRVNKESKREEKKRGSKNSQDREIIKKKDIGQKSGKKDEGKRVDITV